MGEALYYKEQDNNLYLRAEGHVTAALCADLRERVFARLESAPSVEAMYVDLSECNYMDSTFMGLLVGFNKRLLRSASKRLIVVKPTETARDLLAGLGLNALIDIIETTLPFPEGLENVVKTKSASVDLLLKAHENLMELSEENRKKFATLHAALKNSPETKKD
jgi:anti-anti-sigma factor